MTDNESSVPYLFKFGIMFISLIISIISIVYGILALIPTYPFIQQDVSLGVCLIVFSSCIGTIIGTVIMCILWPLLFTCLN